MVVIITSTGGVSKRLFTFERSVDPGLVDWASAYLNENLTGMGLGARMLVKRIADPTLPPTERAFLTALTPAFTELADTAEDTLYVEGAARLVTEHRLQDLAQINELMTMLERRVGLLAVLGQALGARDVLVRIGAENERPELRSFGLVASSYGLPSRKLGTVSLMGPVRMDYGVAITSVREAAHQLSRYIETVYDEA
jgi:heat-inducible transcriptional repressor